MQRNAKFWNRISRRYSRSQIADTAAYEKKLAMTREYLTGESEVLELGCGTGSTALLHAPYVKHIRATDFAPEMIAIAEERRHEAGVANVSFELAAVEDIEAEGARYDVVLALNLLHLVEDLQTALGTMAAVTKPGGVLVASTACLSDSLPALRFVLPVVRPLGLVPMVRFFSEDRLLRECEDAGFGLEGRFRPEGRAAAVFHILRLNS